MSGALSYRGKVRLEPSTMHVNLAFLGVGLWMVGTAIDALPALTAGSILKIVGGVILIVAAVIA